MEPPALARDAQRRAVLSGSAVHASIPGLYAWAVTVAPSAYGRGVPWVATTAGSIAPLLLVAGAYSAGRLGPRSRDASLWSFVLTCAVTWACAPATLGARHIDWTRGASGMLGWCLFALAWAGPPLSPTESATPPVQEPKIVARRPLARGDTAYLALAVVAAASMQLVGWEAVPAERALLVRLVTLATGIGVLGAVAEVAAARHGTRPSGVGRIGLWRGLAIAVVLAAVALGGVLTARGD
jgi:hypothetical protein